MDKNGIDRDRTRTCNPQIRSLVPYPLGHTVLRGRWMSPIMASLICYQNAAQWSVNEDDLIHFLGAFTESYDALEWRRRKKVEIVQLIVFSPASKKFKKVCSQGRIWACIPRQVSYTTTLQAWSFIGGNHVRGLQWCYSHTKHWL